ncbi:glutamine synthetase [Streptomyces sp. AJS327]|uniref:glutamine synthetase family protein n=1 Tax=Streptomyces sp. AJS327 TaxID=2545265 RepID=UPI0015DE8361|nr:glutamine synthetase family protein [Streptomyces sp. AJS327]MBA0051117.1 glutamine synthetase [Streptomyces sp. AJS327]
MSTDPALFVATNDLAGQTRGRAVPHAGADAALRRGVGWVPANLALTAFGQIAPNVFGSVGDLRLLPDAASALDLPASATHPGVRLVLADQVLPDGSPWHCCPRTFARTALADFRAATGYEIVASFEHEFTLDGPPDTAPFSFGRYRGAEPFGDELVALLTDAGLEPETWLPEYGADQFEITLRPVTALAAADRAVLLREVVRDLARRHQRRVSFAPLLDPDGSGNGVHVHLSLRDATTGDPVLYDPARPGRLSTPGARFAAGVLAHARALLGVTAPSPVSYLRLTPHRWSTGGVFLAERNREALLRICPTSTLGGGDPAEQFNLEFRPTDATANPWLTLGVLVRAGLRGITEEYAPPVVWPEDTAEEDLAGVPSLPSGLEEALQELEKDRVVADWFHPDLLDTHLAVKRAELAEVAELDPRERCARIADVH